MRTPPRPRHFQFAAGHVRAINNILAGPRPPRNRRRLPSEKRRSKSPEEEPREEQSPPEEGRLTYEDDRFVNYYEFEEHLEPEDRREAEQTPLRYENVRIHDHNPDQGATADPTPDDREPFPPFEPTIATRHEQSRVRSPPTPRKRYNVVPHSRESVPILFSDKAAHSTRTELVPDPSPDAVRHALELIKDGFTARDLGLACAIAPLARDSRIVRTGPAVVINDVDLYLHDRTIRVASEDGLVTVPDYLEFRGVPETRKVRFNGRTPPWAKRLFGDAEKRRITEPYGPEAPGQLLLPVGGVVEVYKVDGCGWALGKLTDEDRIGWFPVDLTEPLTHGPFATTTFRSRFLDGEPIDDEPEMINEGGADMISEEGNVGEDMMSDNEFEAKVLDEAAERSQESFLEESTRLSREEGGLDQAERELEVPKVVTDASEGAISPGSVERDVRVEDEVDYEDYPL